MERHCPMCGKSSNDVRFIVDICEPCTIKKIQSTLPGVVAIRVCKFCGRIWSAGDFVPERKDSLAVAIKQALRQKDCMIDVLESGQDLVKARFTCETQGKHVTFITELKLKRNYEMCPRCSRIKAGYYEAVVQFRGEMGHVERMAAALQRFMERRDAFISRTETLKTGIDVYASSKKLASEFMLAWKLKPKRSYTLYGMKHGKKLYRNIYSVEV